jgi:uncharacterized membrane protein YhhN
MSNVAAMAPTSAIICVAAVAVLLYAEARRPRMTRLPKMVASTAFIWLALAVGALDSDLGKLILIGLVLSWLGDLLLTYNGRTPFVAGLVTFLLAHVAYVFAFIERGLGHAVYLPLLAMIVVAVPIARWLLPTVPRELRIPVIAYMAVISVMVATAVSAYSAPSTGSVALLTAAPNTDWRIPVGAIAFYLSDLGVARDRFAWPGLVNRMVGLPLYFGGQLLLAWASGS